MGMRLQFVVGILTGLLLAGCAEDLGVDQHGRKVTAEQLDGQWLVINYWAEWCGPCRTEIPELNALEKQLKAQSVQVLGVNFDALQGEKLSRAAQDMGITFTVLMHPTNGMINEGLALLGIKGPGWLVDPNLAFV